MNPSASQPRPYAAVTAACVAVFFLTFPAYARLIGGVRPEVYSDFREHFDIARRVARGSRVPHPLFHLTLIAAAGGDRPGLFPGIAAGLLALATAAAAGLAVAFAGRGCVRLGPLGGVSLGLALALAMPLPTWWRPGRTFLGQVSPNVWHNPTTVFALPFAVLAFVLASDFLSGRCLGRAGRCGAALALGALAKPNFALGFAPPWAALLLVAPAREAVGKWRRTPGRGARSFLNDVGQALLPWAVLGLLPVALVLAWQFRVGAAPGSGLELAPFAVWRLYSPCPPVSLLVGIAFPLAVAALYPREATREPAQRLAWCTLATAVTTYALFAEGGSRAFHGNFIWGVVLADHVLFTAAAALVLRQPAGLRRRLALGVLALHAACGCFCLCRCLVNPSDAPLY